MTRVGPSRALGIVGALVIVLALTQWMLMPEGYAVPSTHTAGPAGLSALYLTAVDLGLPVDRWERPFDPLPRRVAAPTALVVVAPSLPLRPAEAEWLEAWVRDGGRLLYVSDGFGDEFLQRFGLVTHLGCVSVDEPSQAPEACFPPDPALSGAARLLVEGTPSEAVRHWYSLSFEDGEAEPGEVILPASDGDFAAARFLLGDGELIVLSDAEEIGNATLADGGGAVLIMRSLAHLARGETLWFDEYHHGHDARPSLHAQAAGFLVGTDLGGGLLQLALVLIVALAAAGARFGSPIEPEAAVRRSALEHVDALAAAYQGADARRRAARLMRESLRLRLRLRSAAGLDVWLAHLATARPDLGESIAVVRRPDTLADDAALVRFACAVDTLVDTLLEEDRHAARR